MKSSVYIDDRPTSDRPTTDLSYRKFQMAISPQPVVRYTSCLVLGWGIGGRRIEWRYFRFEHVQDGGRPMGFSWLADRVDVLPVEPNLRVGRTSSWKISNEYRPIYWNALSDPFS